MERRLAAAVGTALLLLLGAGREARAGWDPAVWARVRSFLDRADRLTGRKVAVFDFDNTLVFNDLGYAAFIDWVKQGRLARDRPLLSGLLPGTLVDDYLARRGSAADPSRFLSRVYSHYRRLCATDGERSCFAWLSKLYAGHTVAELRAFARTLVSSELARQPCRLELEGGVQQYLGVRPYAEQRELVDLLRKHHIETWVVTASLELLVQHASGHLGIADARVVGVRLQRDGADRLRAELDGPMTYREGKVEAIRRRIRVQPLLVVGDSVTDQEMLGHARELAILIDRGDRGLAALARRRGWAVQPVFRGTAELPACPR